MTRGIKSYKIDQPGKDVKYLMAKSIIVDIAGVGLVLFEQSCIKDSGKTIKDLMDEMTAKVGEKVVIRRYIRYELGEEPPKG